MIDLTKLTDDELEKRRKDIFSRCSHWASCQDGSHGLALHSAGLTDLLDEQTSRKVAQCD